MQNVPWVKERSDARVFLFHQMRLPRASVHLRIGLVGRERFRPTCPAPTMRHLLHLRSIPHAGDRERGKLWAVVGPSGLSQGPTTLKRACSNTQTCMLRHDFGHVWSNMPEIGSRHARFRVARCSFSGVFQKFQNLPIFADGKGSRQKMRPPFGV